MTHKFVVRMSEQQFNLLQEMAEINCSSVNKLINVAIDELLEKYQMIDDLPDVFHFYKSNVDD